MSSYRSTYVPFGCYISGITLGLQTVVTFTTTHAFSVGEVVSFRVSNQYGTVELNNQQPTVSAISTYTITVPIDSRFYTPFIANPTNPQALAMVVPSASGILPGASPPQTNIFDVFDNVPET